MPLNIAPNPNALTTLATIKTLRRFRNWSQSYLAREIGSHVWRISQLERGFAKPRPGELEKIFQVLSTGEGDGSNGAA